MLADFLEARMQIAHLRQGIDHPLSLQLEHQTQRGMRGRMLRAEVERPEVILRAGRIGAGGV